MENRNLFAALRAAFPQDLDAVAVETDTGLAYSWRDLVWQQLIGQGWRGRDYTFGTTLRFTVTSYRRTRELGPLRIEENAVVGGDPDDPSLVIIEFHRRLKLRPWP